MAKGKPAQRYECASTFEQSLQELETIVAELEGGKLGLSQALARYEHGVKHLKACQQLLERAERKIELLSGVDADGNPITRQFDDRKLDSMEEKAAARGRRRSGESKAAAGRAPSRGDSSADIDDAGRLF